MLLFPAPLRKKITMKSVYIYFEMLSLSPFLNRGFISEYFKRSVKIPNARDLLHM